MGISTIGKTQPQLKGKANGLLKQGTKRSGPAYLHVRKRHWEKRTIPVLLVHIEPAPNQFNRMEKEEGRKHLANVRH
jgi:hypothetical protein